MAKAKRTAKQIAATRRLVKLNKERAAGKSSGSKRKSSKGSGASTSSLVGRVSNLEKRVSKHETRIGRVEKTVGGMAEYLMEGIADGFLPPVKDKRKR